MGVVILAAIRGSMSASMSPVRRAENPCTSIRKTIDRLFSDLPSFVGSAARYAVSGHKTEMLAVPNENESPA
jgi:hypothetical protein